MAGINETLSLLFDALDSNHDGVLSKVEVIRGLTLQSETIQQMVLATPALTPFQATQSGPARPAAVSSRSSPPVHIRRVPTKGSSLAICAPPTSTLTISRQVPIGDWCQRKRYDESAKGLYAARPACTVHAWLLSCQLNEPNGFYDEMYNGDEILPPSNRYGTQTDWAALVSPIY